MEAKLQQYRALRHRKELIKKTKDKIEAAKRKIINFLVPDIFQDMDREKKDDEVLLIDPDESEVRKTKIALNHAEPESEELASEVSELESFEDPNEESWRYCIIKRTIYAAVWLTLYLISLKAGFGAVFFVISALIFIYLNTSTRRKKPGEVSAYSVFNRNCESIDGTLKAEDLQRQMLYGLGGLSSPI